MRWERAPIAVRLLALVMSVVGFGMAWRMTWIGAQGLEDIPPPFILVAGLFGLACLTLAALGRYPLPASGQPRQR